MGVCSIMCPLLFESSFHNNSNCALTRTKSRIVRWCHSQEMPFSRPALFNTGVKNPIGTILSVCQGMRLYINNNIIFPYDVFSFNLSPFSRVLTTLAVNFRLASMLVAR